MNIKELKYANYLKVSAFRLALQMILSIICGSTFSSCIETPEDFMNQYEFQGSATDFSQWYMDTRGILDTAKFDKMFIDSIIPKIQVLSFRDMTNIADILRGTSMYTALVNTNVSSGKMTRAFKNFDVYEGVAFYIKARKHFPKLDKVYVDSILPIIYLAPYPILKRINTKFTKSNLRVGDIDSILSSRKDEFLQYIYDELEECRFASIEAYDCAIRPYIELGIDSVCEKQIGTVMNKFAGGFLDYRKILIAFGRDMKKFKELWNKYVKVSGYEEVIYNYSNGFLGEMYALQNDYYYQIMDTNYDLPKNVYKPDAFLIHFPDKEMKLFEDYISTEKLKGWSNLVDMLPSINPKEWIADLIIAGVELGAEFLREDMTPEEKLEEFCKNTILSQITSDYFDNERNKIVRLINDSYHNLYITISNEI